MNLRDSDDDENEEFFDAEDFPEKSTFLKDVNTQLDGLR
jgi:hypothetical protein